MENRVEQYLRGLLAVLLVSVLLSWVIGCSGGGATGAGSPAPTPTLKTGIFVDSPVDGLEYRALSASGTVLRTGVTQDGGKFQYQDGEVVSFHVGDITLGQAFASSQITPVDLVPGAYNETNYKVADIGRLLQSLDHDGQPENGITITDQVRSACRGKAIHMVVDTADTVQNGIASTVKDIGDRGLFHGGQPRAMRTAEQAQAHMRDALSVYKRGQKPGSLPTFANRQELETYLREQYASKLVTGSRFSEVRIVSTGITTTAATAAATGGSSGDASNYSTTTLQEVGVDESDVVKNDGRYIYAAGNGKVTVAKAFPADGMLVVASVPVPGWVNALYLYKQTLVVLYTPGSTGDPGYANPLINIARVGFPYWIPSTAKTGVMMVNVSDPSHPEKIQDFIADGYQVASRVTNGRLHLVQQYRPNVPSGLRYWFDGTEAGRKTVIDRNREILSLLALKDLIPSYTLLDSAGNVTRTGNLVEPENFYRPVEPLGGSIVTITTFQLDSQPMTVTAMGMPADAGTVYASPAALYVAACRSNTVSIMAGAAVEREETVIHQFDLTGDKVTAAGTGTVNGSLLSQYSLGEFGGVLRVATTTGSSTTAANHVYCIKAKEGVLEVIGKIENLAPGETIHAARFLGPRGFLVTFKKIDPLFTLDLSDPTNPTVAGQLKVPGYSEYLYLLDANHLLAVGKDTKQDSPTSNFAWYQGMQLSIFDISDFANPTLKYKELIGVRGTDSEALSDAKAFTFLPEKNLFAFPVKVCEYPNGVQPYLYATGTPVFNGLYVYRVTTDAGFQLLGKVATATSSWTRGVFMDNTVYAVQQNRIVTADIGNMSLAGYVLGWQ